MIGAIQKMAHDFGITLLVVHHNRKMGSTDVYERISGSQGLAGAADSLLVLTRERGEKMGELNITGRDVEERTLTVEFDASLGTWRSVSEQQVEEDKLSAERREILDYLRSNPWSSTGEIARAFKKNRSTVAMNLKRMKAAGLLISDPYGKYNVPPDPADIQLPPDDDDDDETYYE